MSKSLRLSGLTGGSRINRNPGMIGDWIACVVSGSQRFVPSVLFCDAGQGLGWNRPAPPRSSNKGSSKFAYTIE